MRSRKKIVILGGTGFQGVRLATLLRRQGRAFTSLSRGEGTDLRDYTALAKRLKSLRPDVILNCAGHVGSMHYVTRRAADVIDDNLRISLNLYRAVAEVVPHAKIVNIFGNCSYPGAADLQRESGWQAGPVHDSVLAFGFGKRAQYAIAESYRKQYGIASVNWIVCNPYGPENSINTDKLHALNGIIVRMIQAQKAGDKEFIIWGTGKPVREWLYIDDSARIMAYSIDHVAEQTYPVNVAQKKGWTVAQIADHAARELGYKVSFVYDTSKPDGAPKKIMDNALFRAKYPRFTFTLFDRGIRNTVRHFKKLLQ